MDDPQDSRHHSGKRNRDGTKEQATQTDHDGTAVKNQPRGKYQREQHANDGHTAKQEALQQRHIPGQIPAPSDESGHHAQRQQQCQVVDQTDDGHCYTPLLTLTPLRAQQLHDMENPAALHAAGNSPASSGRRGVTL
ncbi:MAG: hypothetical protein NTZ77_02160 [Caldiserica bacterium]|nr:hypothetical protein [Caldisericota bacterium]